MNFILRPVYKTDYQFLFELLACRSADNNISHKKMPSYEEHCRFWDRFPYKESHIILNGFNRQLGLIYITERDEAAFHFITSLSARDKFEITREFILRQKGRRLFFNISPRNKFLRKLFKKMKFKLIQFTYESVF